ncbi:hypothetical protein BN1200_1940002 [Klebsiella variicola]|jgi:hypothetical protein|nr:hypothetical protein BN1200_1940002 [Klebsiella variicola]
MTVAPGLEIEDFNVIEDIRLGSVQSIQKRKTRAVPDLHAEVEAIYLQCWQSARPFET